MRAQEGMTVCPARSCMSMGTVFAASLAPAWARSCRQPNVSKSSPFQSVKTLPAACWCCGARASAGPKIPHVGHERIETTTGASRRDAHRIDHRDGYRRDTCHSGSAARYRLLAERDGHPASRSPSQCPVLGPEDRTASAGSDTAHPARRFPWLEQRLAVAGVRPRCRHGGLSIKSKNAIVRAFAHGAHGAAPFESTGRRAHLRAYGILTDIRRHGNHFQRPAQT
ncbi:hypothetical protein LMG19089_00767 [Ralstonia edaphis]|nr:hypothetical protein LMG19089_00767 [Ralstonia sp. LMG 6871]